MRSARFALDVITDPARRAALQTGGREALDAENIVQLLAQCQALAGHGESGTGVRAYFYSVLVWLASADDPRPLIAEGIWWGTLLPAPQGEGGFGYDPIFRPDGFDCSSDRTDADAEKTPSATATGHGAAAGTARRSRSWWAGGRRNGLFCAQG